MSGKPIPVEDVTAGWMKDPQFQAAYDALEEEFALAAARINARGEAQMTQEQVAAAMGTTQAAIARLESGKTLPSTRTLEPFAKATHTKLRIRFEPEDSPQAAFVADLRSTRTLQVSPLVACSRPRPVFICGFV